MSQMALVFDVPFAVGHRARTTCGLVPAGMSGIRSIPVECAPPVSTSGHQLNACHAAVGRRIPTGTRIETFAQKRMRLFYSSQRGHQLPEFGSYSSTSSDTAKMHAWPSN
jgi:hypothetical protein